MTSPASGPSRSDDERSPKQLIRATLVAATVAAVLLTVAVLPAEYGLDPTGLGQRLGLLRARAAEPVDAQVTDPSAGPKAPGQIVTRESGPYRTEELSVTLGWREGAEIKAHMRQGQRLVFSWAVDNGAVDMDMHGERINAPDGEFTSYWKEDQIPRAAGTFEAPFDGTHGWFWQNFAQEPVTVTVKVSGYFDRIGQP